MARDLSPEDLYRFCDDRIFDFRTTVELPPLDGIIGQDRALEAIRFGLAMKNPGYKSFQNRRLDRRAFLRGAGACVALP